MRSDPEPAQLSTSVELSYVAPLLKTQEPIPSIPGLLMRLVALFSRQPQVPALQLGLAPAQAMQVVPQWALSLLVS